jgi:uncharacterized protein (DUF924 family)
MDNKTKHGFPQSALALVLLLDCYPRIIFCGAAMGVATPFAY